MSSVAGVRTPITPIAFIQKWKKASLTERQTAQEHFIDLCSLFDHPTPTEDDPTGERFAFEKGAMKVGGGKGFADVWKRDYFAWEYKRKNGNLDDALHQLIRYAPALESPPLQVVCDIEHFRIHTAWTNTVPAKYEIKLDDLADASCREILRNVFYNPEKLKPTKTRAAVTKEAADKFSTIALRLIGRGTPEEIAHFVNQLVFCFFADSVKLLPDGLLQKLLKRSSQNPARAQKYFNDLFEAMESGGDFDLDDIAWFNGGLFDGRRALSLDEGDVGLLVAAASLDWGLIDPSIFGTLFERFLDPDKRAQIGAHYTDREKITKIIEPVILKPLREEWAVSKIEIRSLLAGDTKPPMRKKQRRRMTRLEAAEEVRSRYLERLLNLRILDPACGSGNFLYLALQGVKDIENKANLESEMLGLAPRLPIVGPEILRGIEINPLAAELARTTIWIGDIQWRLRNGIHAKPRPILRKLDAIECRDALIAVIPTLLESGTAAKQPKLNVRQTNYSQTSWPEAEFIVGNPPFLGTRLMRTGLGHQAVEQLFFAYEGCVSREADLVCYWFEKARAALKAGHTKRVGLVATNSIRGGANRKVLDQISSESRVFEAWSDEPWVIDGAAVRVSLVCFGDSSDPPHLDGQRVSQINSDLTSGQLDLTKAMRLAENRNVASNGISKKGKFEIDGSLARDWIQYEYNPNGQPNASVLAPWRNGEHVTRERFTDKWIINFSGFDELEASQFQAPFEYVKEKVKPFRDRSNSTLERRYWWRLARPASGLFETLRGLRRFIVTPEVSKYRIFVWFDAGICPDKNLIAIGRDDDVCFGILHTRFHRAWSLRLGTSLEDRPRYTCSTTFDTFPFPDGLTPNVPAKNYSDNPHALAIGKAARRLDDLRNVWLNPTELVRIEADVLPNYPKRVLPKNTTAAATLRDRTLTGLYNQNPQWLKDAHRDLDEAVACAYGWPIDISEEEALTKLLELNLLRSASSEGAATSKKTKRSQRAVPEEARRSPQFKLPISGGKPPQEGVPSIPALIEQSEPPKRAPLLKRKSRAARLAR
jgi:type II restriction/modification system DNA methylase subunit YeeA